MIIYINYIIDHFQSDQFPISIFLNNTEMSVIIFSVFQFYHQEAIIAIHRILKVIFCVMKSIAFQNLQSLYNYSEGKLMCMYTRYTRCNVYVLTIFYTENGFYKIYHTLKYTLS